MMEIHEGDWIEFIHNGDVFRGVVERKWKDKPFGEDNFWINVGGSMYQPEPHNIIKVYKKVTFPYNPSSR